MGGGTLAVHISYPMLHRHFSNFLEEGEAFSRGKLLYWAEVPVLSIDRKTIPFLGGGACSSLVGNNMARSMHAR